VQNRISVTEKHDGMVSNAEVARSAPAPSQEDPARARETPTSPIGASSGTLAMEQQQQQFGSGTNTSVAARPPVPETIEQRVGALKGEALKAELRRLFGTQTGGVKGVAAQREKLVAALRAEEAGEPIPGQWVEDLMEDPNPSFTPREGEEEGAKGEAATLVEDETATPLAFFLLFFTESIIGRCTHETRHTPISHQFHNFLAWTT
jgi:hypothetical protein